MAHHTDYFVGPDEKVKFEPVTSGRGTVTLVFGDWSDGVTIFFPPESFAQLLAVADQAEKAWGSTLQEDQ